MGKYWKSPVEKAWFTFICDGKVLEVMQDSAKCDRERARLQGLHGISVVPTTPDHHIKKGSKTVIPVSIINKMQSAALKQRLF
jgi:hypothetical protein